MNILVSACLLNVQCRYDRSGMLHNTVAKLLSSHHLIPVCPEIFGGLGIPRPPAELKDNSVVSITGEDITKNFEIGAIETLKLAKLYNCKLAILKERSPSCGSGTVYDGSFTGILIDGNGITAKLLSENGIDVIGESKIIDYFSLKI